MADKKTDWTLATWDGLRIRQMEEYRRLPFREKLLSLEQMAEVTNLFRHSRNAEERPRSSGEE